MMANRVAIIGLGGTGSYILDLLAKTPIAEVHIFDGDVFSLHNAFRSPGAPKRDELTDPKKVDWFGAIYDKMRVGIIRHPYDVEAGQLSELAGFEKIPSGLDWS
jgi:tRNA A37 threonylcarbamoyladenosine dehydratase